MLETHPRPYRTLLFAAAIALAASACGGRQVGPNAGDDSAAGGAPDLGVAAPDTVLAPDRGSRAPDASSPRADLGVRPDTTAAPDSARVADGGAPPADAAPPKGTFEQSDDPMHGVVSGSVWLDPKGCPTPSCGSDPSVDCKGELYIELTKGVFDLPLRAYKVVADLRSSRRVYYRFKGLPPGGKYIVRAFLAESGSVPADRKPVTNDVYRNYQSVVVPPAGFETRHDVVLMVRKDVRPSYPGTTTLTFDLSLGSGTVCSAGDPARDCRGFVEISVLNYSQNKTLARVITSAEVDLSRGAATVLLPTSLPSIEVGTLFVSLYEQGKPVKPHGWIKGNLGHYESPFFLPRVCTATNKTLSVKLRRR